MKNFKKSVVLAGGLLLAINAEAAFSSTTHATALIDWNSLQIRTIGVDGVNPSYTIFGQSSSSNTNTSDWLNWSAATSTSGRKFGVSISGDEVGNGSASASRSASLSISGNGFLMMSAKYSLDAAIYGFNSSCTWWTCDSNAANVSVSFDLTNYTNGNNQQSHVQKRIDLGNSWVSPLTADKKTGTLLVGVAVNDGDLLNFSSSVSAYAKEVLSNSVDNTGGGLVLSSGGGNISIGGSVVTLANFAHNITVLPVSAAVTAVPLPGAVWMFGSALLGLVSFGRQRRALLA